MDLYVAAVTISSGLYEVLKFAALALAICALIKYLRAKLATNLPW